MKGQMVALEQASIQKKCNIKFQAARRERARRSCECMRRKACPAAPAPTPKGGPHPSSYKPSHAAIVTHRTTKAEPSFAVNAPPAKL